MKEKITEAIEVLKKGGIILYPTDTIWGLGCDATNEDAVKRIFEIKEREDSKSLIVLANNLDMVYKYVNEVPEMAAQMAELSNSPLTIIYPHAIGLAPNIIAEDKSIAIRIPNHRFCQELIKTFRKPIVSTSANVSGENYPKSYSEIHPEITSKVDWIADTSHEEGSTNSPSAIIKIELDSQIRIIRE